jgi:hypothetical protein
MVWRFEVRERHSLRQFEVIALVGLPSAENRGVDRWHQHGCASGMGALDKLPRDSSVTVEIHLKPPVACVLRWHSWNPY